MHLFDKIKDPVFLKEDSSAQQQLSELKRIRKNAGNDLSDCLDEEICKVQAGIYGEQAVHFELENSHIPMLILHDLCLSFQNLSAQIDYLIITRKHVFVLECKNLYGSIEINHSGDFVRTLNYGGRTRKEGIYSPITQNRRHLELIKAMRGSLHSHTIGRTMFEKDFYNVYQSVVVLANPKTVLYDRYAPREIKAQVIRADQLADYIRKADADTKRPDISEKDMMAVAEFFLQAHTPCQTDYTEKYRRQPEEQMRIRRQSPASSQPERQILCPLCGAPMVKRKASKGPHAGQIFYGCSNYPRCKGIVNLS